MQQCNSCKGQGKYLSRIDCTKCNAKGKIIKEFTSMSASNIEFCSSCGGDSSHDNPCSVCGATGRTSNLVKKTRQIKCAWCNGTGQTNKCEDCIASGQKQVTITCPMCSGKGKMKKVK